MPGVTAEELEQSINDAASIYTLDASRNVGDIFYEPSTTANIEHGHVGIYYTTDTIVESMPSSGVRSLIRLNKKVAKGSKIFTLDGVSQSVKNGASS